MKGIDSYDNGRKETWRGWQWNRIEELLRGRYRDEVGSYPSDSLLRKYIETKTVVYLCGPEDSDRPHAMRRGFRPENLFAIDISLDRVKAVRKRGGLALRGKVEHALLSWPDDFKIDVLILDSCYAFAVNTGLLMFECAIASPGIHPYSVVSVNLLRGRDASTNKFRDTRCGEIARALSNSDPVTTGQKLAHRYLKECAADPLHRGKNLFMWHSVGGLLGGGFPPDWVAKLNPSFSSYRGSGESFAFMDSAVFRSGVGYQTDKVERGEIEKELTAQYGARWNVSDKRMKSKLAALRAVRTMKLKATA